MNAVYRPPAPAATQYDAPQAFVGTEPGYFWWLIGPGEVIGVRVDSAGRAIAVTHGTIGRLLASDRPLGGLTGYDTWHPLPGATATEGAWGYWIAHLPVTPAAAGGEQQ